MKSELSLIFKVFLIAITDKISNRYTNNYYSNSLYCADELLVFTKAKA